MPRLKLTKSAIDALPKPHKDIVYWDSGSPGFGLKVTPKGRKVFMVFYRTAGAGPRLRKYTIGPYGRVTLHQARAAAQKVQAARLEGRDPARRDRRNLEDRATRRPDRRQRNRIAMKQYYLFHNRDYEHMSAKGNRHAAELLTAALHGSLKVLSRAQ